MTDLFAMRVTVPEDTLINVIEAESVLLNLKSERYFGLDEVGTRMWQVMTTAESLQQAFETLSGEYAVEPEVLRRDMEDLIDKLTEHGLLELSEPGPVEAK